MRRQLHAKGLLHHMSQEYPCCEETGKFENAINCHKRLHRCFSALQHAVSLKSFQARCWLQCMTRRITAPWASMCTSPAGNAGNGKSIKPSKHFRKSSHAYHGLPGHAPCGKHQQLQANAFGNRNMTSVLTPASYVVATTATATQSTLPLILSSKAALRYKVRPYRGGR